MHVHGYVWDWNWVCLTVMFPAAAGKAHSAVPIAMTQLNPSPRALLSHCTAGRLCYAL
jgi:hypothetical protein